MLALAGILLKLKTFGLSMLASTVKHWRIILPVAMVVLAYWYVSEVQAQRDDAVRELEEYQQQSDREAEKRRIENANKQKQATFALEALQQRHTDQLNILRKKYETLHKNDKTAAELTIAELRDRLRTEIAREVYGLSRFPETAGLPAQSGGDCDAAFARDTGTLELACAITTADYNNLRLAWDKACEVYGCE